MNAPQIAFRPSTLREQAIFSLRGRRLLRRAVLDLAGAREGLCPLARWGLQAEWADRLLEHLDVSVEVRGAGHVLRTPHVIIALHEGMLDALCLMRLGLPMRIAARTEIFSWPGFGAAIRNMRHIAIDPEAGAGAYRTLLREAKTALADGDSVLLFPQGTVLGIETEFRSGAFRLARRLGAPLLPIAIAGSHRVWEHPFSPCLRYGQRVVMEILPAVSPEQVRATTAEELRQRLQTEMKRVALASGEARRYLPERDGWWDGYSFGIDPAFPELRESLARHRASNTTRPRVCGS